jgi:hypothetical protein
VIVEQRKLYRDAYENRFDAHARARKQPRHQEQGRFTWIDRPVDGPETVTRTRRVCRPSSGRLVPRGTFSNRSAPCS